jgi:hypothetical protein
LLLVLLRKCSSKCFEIRVPQKVSNLLAIWATSHVFYYAVFAQVWQLTDSTRVAQNILRHYLNFSQNQQEVSATLYCALFWKSRSLLQRRGTIRFLAHAQGGRQNGVVWWCAF